MKIYLAMPHGYPIKCFSDRINAEEFVFIYMKRDCTESFNEEILKINAKTKVMEMEVDYGKAIT